MSDDKSGKVRQRNVVFVASILFIVVLVGYTLAHGITAVVRDAGTATNIVTVDDTNAAVFNISVNLTNGGHVGPTNISAVVINFSLNGKYLNLSDSLRKNTSVDMNDFNFTLVTTNWSLNWTNHTIPFLINWTNGSNIHYFWFGVSPNGAVPVKSANISVALLRVNNSNVYNASNLTFFYNVTLNVNDSFTISYVGNSNASGVNLSQNYIPLHLNITGNQTPLSLRVSLHNSTGQIYRNISVGGAVNNGSGIAYNFSNLTNGVDLPEGTYVLEVIANNSDGDMNNTANRTYILDMTAPTVTLAQDNASTATTKTQVTVTLTISDTRTGINSTCDSTTSTATITGTGTTQTLVESGLTCGTSHTYYVTCVDTAGNRNSAASINTATLSCGSGSSAGASGGSASGGTASGGTAAGGSASGVAGNDTSSAVGGAGGAGSAGSSGSGIVGEQPETSEKGKLPVVWIVIVAVLVIVAIVYVVMSRKSGAK